MTWLLDLVLDHPFATVVGAFAVCLAGVYGMARLPEQTLLLDVCGDEL